MAIANIEIIRQECNLEGQVSKETLYEGNRVEEEDDEEEYEKIEDIEDKDNEDRIKILTKVEILDHKKIPKKGNLKNSLISQTTKELKMKRKIINLAKDGKKGSQ